MTNSLSDTDRLAFPQNLNLQSCSTEYDQIYSFDGPQDDRNRSDRSKQKPNSLTGNNIQALELLELEMKQLSNAINHLKRSNEELKEALTDCPDDEDFVQAIKENEGAIRWREERVNEIENELKNVSDRYKSVTSTTSSLLNSMENLQGNINVNVGNHEKVNSEVERDNHDIQRYENNKNNESKMPSLPTTASSTMIDANCNDKKSKNTMNLDGFGVFL